MPRKHSKLITQDASRTLPDPKWELFAQAMAEGRNQSEAAQLSGSKGKSLAVRGSELMRKPGVAARVDYLRSKSSEIAVRTTALSKSRVLHNLEEITRLAIQAEDYSSANRANELIGKELGMFIERKVLGIQDLRSMSPDDLLRLTSEIDSQLTAIECKALPEGAPETPQVIEPIADSNLTATLP